jgi:hypothetical protein
MSAEERLVWSVGRESSVRKRQDPGMPFPAEDGFLSSTPRPERPQGPQGPQGPQSHI